MEDVCRVCLELHDDMVNIFEETEELGPSIPDMIAEWSGHKVEKGDSLPENICPSCLEDAKNVFELQEVSEIGYKYLCQVKEESIEEDLLNDEFGIISSSASEGSRSFQEFNCQEKLDSNEENFHNQIGYPFEDKITLSETDQSDSHIKDDKENELFVRETNKIDSHISEEKVSYMSVGEIKPDCQNQEIKDVVSNIKEDDDKDHCRPKSFLSHVTSTQNVDRPHKCSICMKSFARYCSFKNHLTTHENNQKNECDSTSDFTIKAPTYKGKRSLKSEFIGNNTFPKVEETIPIMPLLDQYSADKAVFQCSYCLKNFLSSSSLRMHIRVHTGERPYKCDQCPNAFKQHIDLRRHILTHTKEKPVKCKFCEKSFTHHSSLKLHMRHHPEKKNQCHFCQKFFLHSTSLKIHLRVHTGERPYKCDRCPNAFKQNIDLKRHIMTHTNELPMKCTNCDLTFRHHSSLKFHMRKHDGEKFKCLLCPKTFRGFVDLKHHRSTHLKNRSGKKKLGERIQCDHCLSSFTDPNSLRGHMRIHTGERPYKCTHCEMAFICSADLRRHTSKHTGEKPYKCDKCPKAFVDSRTLKAHTRIHTST